jgi:hypothetical protein
MRNKKLVRGTNHDYKVIKIYFHGKITTKEETKNRPCNKLRLYGEQKKLMY